MQLDTNTLFTSKIILPELQFSSFLNDALLSLVCRLLGIRPTEAIIWSILCKDATEKYRDDLIP